MRSSSPCEARFPAIELKTLTGAETAQLMQSLYDQTLPIMQKNGVYWGDKK